MEGQPLQTFIRLTAYIYLLTVSGFPGFWFRDNKNERQALIIPKEIVYTTANMKLLSQKQFKDIEEEQVTLQPEEPEDMVTTT